MSYFAPASLESAVEAGPNGHNHQTHWTEENAIELSSEFFKGIKWNKKRFPFVKKMEIPTPTIALNDVCNRLF